MPRKKKTGQSPARAPGLSAERGVNWVSGLSVAGQDMEWNESKNMDNMATDNLTNVRFSGKEEVVNKMQEMFSHLDPEVIYLVLNECDFRVEHAMDSLLELSVAAEGTAPGPAAVSGFELAAALLYAKPQQDEPSAAGADRPQVLGGKMEVEEDLDVMGNRLTAEFDSLIDREMESLSTQPPLFDSAFPSVHQEAASCQPLPELLPSSVGQDPGPGLGLQFPAEGGSGGLRTFSPPKEASFSAPSLRQEAPGLLDFSHLATESPSRNPTLDLGSHGRPSAFQAYKKSPKTRGTTGGQITSSSQGAAALPEPGNGSALGQSLEGKEPLASPSLFWNPQAPEFQPQNPAFITPVVLNPTPWGSQSSRHWFTHDLVQQAPLKPAATIPKSWTLPASPRPPALRPPAPVRSARLEGKVLVLMRGAPGSGKSTLASILVQNSGGVVLSSDEFFCRNGHYCYDPALLGEAHEWNHCRAKEAFEKNTSPIIIDNTNMQSWEMKPYVALAKQHNYKVMFREPDTWWKFKPRELERRTKHGVSKEKIKRMLERYEHHVSVDSVMRSFDKRPELTGSSSMTHPLPETSLSQPLPSEVKPDLVEEPHLGLGLAQGYAHVYSHAQLFSSLPDVSSVGRGSTRDESLGAGSSKSSSRSSSIQGSSVSLPSHELATQGGAAELLNTSMLDWEEELLPTPECKRQASEWEGNPEFGWQNQDPAEEQPVAFSESISQRVRRVRGRPTQTVGGNEDGVKYSSSDDTLEEKASQCGGKDEAAAGCDRVRPELLDFVGDWPSEAMERREQRLRAERGKGAQQNGKGSAEQDGNPRVKVEGAEQNETQKLLDLLQIGTSFTSVGSPVDFMLHSSNDLSKDPEPGCQVTQSSTPSSREGLDQKAGRDTRPELLDCIADWTISDVTLVRDAPQSLAPETSLPSPAQTGIFTPEKGSEQKREVEESETSPVSRRDFGPTKQNAGSPGAILTSPVSGGSHERRLRQSRRSGKQCKLALTFTSPTSPRLPESPVTQPHLAAISPETLAPRHTSSSTQTDTCDFALLWRLDQSRQEDMTAMQPNVRVLVTNCTRFHPGPPSAMEPPTQQVVPYRAVHDKGIQLEEQELMSSDGSSVQDLQILSRHFKLVSYDTLEDLYDKCHQDIEWTTNLLLDSGEELFKDDDDPPSEAEQTNEKHLPERSGLDPKADSPKVCQERETPILLGAEQLKALPNPESQGAGADGSFMVVETHPVPEKGPDLEELIVTAQYSNGVEEPSLVVEETSVNDFFEPEKHSVGQPKEVQDAPAQLLDFREPEGAGGLEVGSEHQGNPPQSLDLGCPLSKNKGSLLVLEEEESREPGDLPNPDEMTLSLVSQLEEMNRRDRLEEERERERAGEKRRAGQDRQDPTPLNIQSLELKLPAELAFQLSELFGPVGIAPGSWSPEDCSVQIDLNLARLLHQKWKETIQERQLQEALSYHLLQESSEHWGEPQPTKGAPTDGARATRFLFGPDGFASLGQSEAAAENFPFMDHWSAPQSHVSLRDIMLEEQALQESMEKSRESRAEGRKDGAALLKEQQLYSMFPSIDRHFLNDIFKDHNYSLEQTTQFLTSLLDEGPVRTVVAQDTASPRDPQRACSSERRRKGKEAGTTAVEFQDTQDPDYEDFRTEATLQRRKQQESYSKAAEAYRQGMKDVAGFYAQQGHLHRQKMKEANSRAAMQIFKRVNATLLPQNILDLHGLHVDEALFHLQRVLEEKTAEWKQGGCRPQLSVITGRGNHSQGGVARIRPAVIDYLTNLEYTFTEPKCGLVLVTLH